MFALRTVLGAGVLELWAAVLAQQLEPYDYVDPLIGTVNGGANAYW
jgi:hypothetical protein